MVWIERERRNTYSVLIDDNFSAALAKPYADQLVARFRVYDRPDGGTVLAGIHLTDREIDDVVTALLYYKQKKQEQLRKEARHAAATKQEGQDPD